MISAPAGVTWRLREAAANGSRRARGRTVAWTRPARPLGVELEAAARLLGPVEARERLRQPPVRPPAVDRRQRVDGDERHRTPPARGAGEHDRRRQHLVVRPDRRLAVADQRADGHRQRRRPRSSAGSRPAAPGAAGATTRTASSTVAHGAGADAPGSRAASSSASADSATPSISWSVCTPRHHTRRRPLRGRRRGRWRCAVRRYGIGL